jgi:hypothetical protein
MLLLLPLVFTSGCATKALWTCSALDNRVEPAAKPNLRLYATTSPPDFLVIYDASSGRKHTNSTRAYFLNQNLERIRSERAPHFVDVELAHGLPPVPVFYSSPVFDWSLVYGTNQPSRPFAVSDAKAQSFTLYFRDGGSEFYHLPIYSDGTVNFTRVALTPLAVTSDVILVGGEICVLCFLAEVQSGASVPQF